MFVCIAYSGAVTSARVRKIQNAPAMRWQRSAYNGGGFMVTETNVIIPEWITNNAEFNDANGHPVRLRQFFEQYCVPFRIRAVSILKLKESHTIF